jgi:hypothetical protein
MQSDYFTCSYPAKSLVKSLRILLHILIFHWVFIAIGIETITSPDGTFTLRYQRSIQQRVSWMTYMFRMLKMIRLVSRHFLSLAIWVIFPSGMNLSGTLDTVATVFLVIYKTIHAGSGRLFAWH